MKLTLSFEKRHLYFVLVTALLIGSISFIFALPPNPGHIASEIGADSSFLAPLYTFDNDVWVKGRINFGPFEPLVPFADPDNLNTPYVYIFRVDEPVPITALQGQSIVEITPGGVDDFFSANGLVARNWANIEEEDDFLTGVEGSVSFDNGVDDGGLPSEFKLNGMLGLYNSLGDGVHAAVFGRAFNPNDGSTIYEIDTSDLRTGGGMQDVYAGYFDGDVKIINGDLVLDGNPRFLSFETPLPPEKLVLLRNDNEFLRFIRADTGNPLLSLKLSDGELSLDGNLLIDDVDALFTNTINPFSGNDLTLNANLIIPPGRELRTNSINPSSGTGVTIAGDLQIEPGNSIRLNGVERTTWPEKIVRGTVNGDGTIDEGLGFTISKGPTGVFDINFNINTFSDTPSVICTGMHPTDQQNTEGRLWCIVDHPNQITNNKARVIITDSSAILRDWPFSFIAIGPS